MCFWVASFLCWGSRLHELLGFWCVQKKCILLGGKSHTVWRKNTGKNKAHPRDHNNLGCAKHTWGVVVWSFLLRHVCADFPLFLLVMRAKCIHMSFILGWFIGSRICAKQNKSNCWCFFLASSVQSISKKHTCMLQPDPMSRNKNNLICNFFLRKNALTIFFKKSERCKAYLEGEDVLSLACAQNYILFIGSLKTV